MPSVPPITAIFAFLLLIVVTVSHAVSAPPAPTNDDDIIGSIPGQAQAVAVQDTYAYVGFDTTFTVIDIRDPTTPTIVGQLDVGELVRDIAVHEQYAYLALTTGLLTVDITQPTAPQALDLYPQYLVTDLILRDEQLFSLSSNGLKIFDISAPPANTACTL